MKSFLLFCLVTLGLSLTVMSCSSDSDSNPAATNEPTPVLVGNWRHAAFATQQSGVTGYSVAVFVSDSAYMTIDSSGHFVYEMRHNNVVTMRMTGHGSYSATQMITIIDSIVQTSSSPDTIRAGDTIVQTATLSNNNTVLHIQGRSKTTNLINYGAYLKTGADVKIAGVCADYNESAMTNWVGKAGVTVRCLNSVEVALQTTTTNNWGFFVFTGLTPQTLRPSGWIVENGSGIAYDNSPLPITANGIYTVMLMR